MCIVFVIKNIAAEYPLIILANRDEFFERPTEFACWWSDHPTLYAGRDLQAGGSWLGINCRGEFAAVTNVRTEKLTQDNPSSRGELVVKSLVDNKPEDLIKKSADYSPFNLIYGDSEQVKVFHSANKQLSVLNPGIHAISNGNPKDYWPKMKRGCKRLQALFDKPDLPQIAELHEMLLDTEKADYQSLPLNGLDLPREHQLSSIFIPATQFSQGLYGTRSSSILLINKNQWRHIEWNYNDTGEVLRKAGSQYSVNSNSYMANK